MATIYKQIFAVFMNFLRLIKKFSLIIIIVVLIGFNVLTLASAAIYSALHGLFSSLPVVNSLFDNSIQSKNKKLQNKNKNLQSKIKNQQARIVKSDNISKKQKMKINKSKKYVKQQRGLLGKRTIKNLGKKTASWIPGFGIAVSIGLSAEEYCQSLKENMELSNILNGTSEIFSHNKCYSEMKENISGNWSLW